jgi:hypothetical protein
MRATQLDKIEKVLGTDTVKELEALSSADLETRIVSANQAMQQAEDELEANPKYEELKENLKALSAAKRDVNKRQKSIIKLCLHYIESRGGISDKEPQ